MGLGVHYFQTHPYEIMDIPIVPSVYAPGHGTDVLKFSPLPWRKALREIFRLLADEVFWKEHGKATW